MEKDSILKDYTFKDYVIGEYWYRIGLFEDTDRKEEIEYVNQLREKRKVAEKMTEADLILMYPELYESFKTLIDKKQG